MNTPVPTPPLHRGTFLKVWETIAAPGKPVLKLDPKTHQASGTFASLEEAFDSGLPCLVHPRPYIAIVDADYTELESKPNTDKLMADASSLIQLLENKFALYGALSGRVGKRFKNQHIFIVTPDQASRELLKATFAKMPHPGLHLRLNQASRPPFSPYHKDLSIDLRAGQYRTHSLTNFIYAAMRVEKRILTSKATTPVITNPPQPPPKATTPIPPPLASSVTIEPSKILNKVIATPITTSSISPLSGEHELLFGKNRPHITLKLRSNYKNGERSEALFAIALSMAGKGLPVEQAFREIYSTHAGAKLREMGFTKAQVYFNKLFQKARRTRFSTSFTKWQEDLSTKLVARLHRYYKSDVQTIGDPYRHRTMHLVYSAMIFHGVANNSDQISLSCRQIASLTGCSAASVLKSLRKLRDRNFINKIIRHASRAAANVYQVTYPSDLDIQTELANPSPIADAIIVNEWQFTLAMALIKKSARSEITTTHKPANPILPPYKKTYHNKCRGFGYRLGKVFEFAFITGQALTPLELIASITGLDKPSVRTVQNWLIAIRQAIKNGLITESPEGLIEAISIVDLRRHKRVMGLFGWLDSHRRNLRSQQSIFLEDYRIRSSVYLAKLQHLGSRAPPIHIAA